jgi:hypothetical protein
MINLKETSFLRCYVTLPEVIHTAVPSKYLRLFLRPDVSYLTFYCSEFEKNMYLHHRKDHSCLLCSDMGSQ